MLDQLIQMATQQLGQQMIADPNIPNNEFDVNQVAQTAGSSIFESIAGQISNGNLGALQEMVSGQQTNANNPLVSGIAQNVINALVQKSGLNPALAQSIASMAVPFVMNMFNGQASAAQSNGIDMGSLITGAMTGGGNNSGGGGLLGGLLGGLFGGNKGQQQDMGTQVIGSVLSQLMK